MILSLLKDSFVLLFIKFQSENQIVTKTFIPTTILVVLLKMNLKGGNGLKDCKQIAD